MCRRIWHIRSSVRRNFVAVVLILIASQLVSANVKLVANFRSDSAINNILVADGRVYVGSVNSLYALNISDLGVLNKVSTGPLLDSPQCSTDLETCIGPRDSIKEVDNYNKILTKASELLLVCGSVRQGSCEWREPSTLAISSTRERSTIPVAANAPDASTVALYLRTEQEEEELYVAASFTADTPYRESFPAVTTRSIPSLLTLNSGSIEGEAAVIIRAEYRSRFRVKYVSSFTEENYVYWAAVQNRDVKGTTMANPLVSRLIRVCRGDDKYISYSEIDLQCIGEDNRNYNVVRDLKRIGSDLIGVFNDATGKHSAICVFSLSKIRMIFWYNIDRCWGGSDTIGLPHIGRDSNCVNRSRLVISEDTCSLGIGGTTISANEAAAFRVDNRLLTAVDARVVHSHTIVVAGSSSGDILQLELIGDHSKRLEQYDDFGIGPDSVDRLQFIDEDHYLATSGNELLTYKVSVCPEKANCDRCSALKDPLCGFCLSAGKCSSQAQCQTQLVKQCPHSANSPTPSNVSVTDSGRKIFFPIENLPMVDSHQQSYECYYGPFKALGEWNPNGIRCGIPTEKPQMPLGSDSVTVPLSIRHSDSSYDIVSHNFTFYDCGVYSICSKCSLSKWQCSWCPSERHCLSTDFSCSSPASKNGECPRIEMSALPSLLVADSTNASIAFGVANLDGGALGLRCSIVDPLSPSKQQIVPATFVSRTKVECASAQFRFESDLTETNFSLELKRGEELLDKVPVTVYKCSQMAADCSQCLALDPKYHCTWCSDGCNFHDQCPKRNGKAKADSLCTEPFIQSFHPNAGPIEGGTKIEIIGRDLGSRIQDVRDRVMVAGSKCRVVDYEVSVRIVCIVESGTGSGPIRITIGRTGRRTVESANHFQFREPVITSIYPTFGPISGGTLLTLHGDNLNVGSNVSIHLDNHPCQLIPTNRKRNEIQCRTSPSQRIYTVTAIRLQIDENVRILNTNFEYRPDPQVEKVSPTVIFESGGRQLIIEGTNFYSILNAQTYLVSDADPEKGSLVSELSSCRILNSTRMLCNSPPLVRSLAAAALGTSRHDAAFSRFPIGFHMDGVRSVQNLGRRIQMTIVPDPQMATFKGVRTLALGQPLVIEGSHLDVAASPSEYNITIGTFPCPVIILESKQIVCQTPDRMPLPTDDVGRELKDGRALVVVRVGSGQIRTEIGPVEFADAANLRNSAFVRTNLLRLVLILICGVGILAIGILLLFLLWRRRNNEHERAYKRIQLQMEQMESNVRNECKQAFAELQTDMMTDLNSTLTDIGIPFIDRADFVGRLLFRDSLDASILNGYGTAGIYSTRTPMAIVQFESLLYNRQFVTVMVEMVDSNPAISTSERTTLSSLLFVAMSRDLVYCTEVIFSLLSSHIQQMTERKNAHLLFRRSDSLVEKLFQHWLSFTLFPSVIEPTGSGRQFFLLYKALKYQTEKGPVDVCTGNARYSLSEQKLLRESVDANPVVLTIIPVIGFDQAPVPLRVLDCDTISQVKSKLLDVLYKNIPFSKRMTIDQFDLEWRCPRRGNILLLDDDQPQLKGLKKLHTVRFYGLQSNSVLTMQQRGQHSFTFRSESGGSSDTTCSAWSSTHLIDSNGLPVSPVGSCDQSVHYFHLSTPAANTLSSIHKHASAFLTLDKKQRNKHSIHRQSSQQHLFGDDLTSRNIPEVFLTRLVMCKGTVQQYIDAFFDTVTFANCDPNRIPVVLKYVLDFLDAEAARNNVVDPDIIHAWKTNAYVLRFWMQLLHNPDCLFDIQRLQSVDASLTVIGQTMIDAFSRSDLHIGRETPSSKLLFAKDIDRYRSIAAQTFTRIRSQSPIDQEKFGEYIQSLSNLGMSTQMAVTELLNWSKANILKLSELLDQDRVAVKLRLGERLQETVRCSLPPTIEPEHVYATLN